MKQVVVTFWLEDENFKALCDNYDEQKPVSLIRSLEFHTEVGEMSEQVAVHIVDDVEI